jgi:hypothetical protein
MLNYLMAVLKIANLFCSIDARWLYDGNPHTGSVRISLSSRAENESQSINRLKPKESGNRVFAFRAGSWPVWPIDQLVHRLVFVVPVSRPLYLKNQRYMS